MHDLPVAPPGIVLNPAAQMANADASPSSAHVIHITLLDQLSDVIPNPCTGELIPFTARHFEEIDVSLRSVQVTESVIGGGTADVTGVQYLVNDVSHEAFQQPDPSSTHSNEFVMPHTIKLISQGAGGQNFLEHVVFHVIILPGGEATTTANFASPTAGCGACTIRSSR